MTKKLLKQLIQISYTGNILDKIKVDNIASLLSRKDLKTYIKGIKTREKEMTVELTLANSYNQNEYMNIFKPLLISKRLTVTIDPSLLLGVRITDNDLVYDFSLGNSMQQVQQYIEENF